LKSHRPAFPSLAALILGALVTVACALPAVAAGTAAPVTAAPATAADSWNRSSLWGGDVRSLAFDPRDPDRVFAGTSGGHVYRSDDAGLTWTDAGDTLALPGWVVSDLDFDPDVPGRLWAALWGTWGGGMVVVSDDSGATWQPRGYDDLKDTQVYTVARAPGSEGRLYAGTLSGVWASTDGGESWRRLTVDLPQVHKVTSILVGPDDPQRVVVGTWERAYRSDDGGLTWYGIFDGMLLDSEVFTLTPVPGQPDQWWASTCGWVYRTHDAGGRWQRYTQGFENRRTPAFAALPAGRLLAGTVAGLHVSDDDGRTWRRTGPDDLSIFDVAYHPQRPDLVLLATEGSGVWRSTTGGLDPRPATQGMRNLRVAAMVKAGREILVAVNHAGPSSGIHASRDGGRTFQAEPAELPTVRDLVVHGISVYAATERGLWERAGASWRRVGEVGEARVEQVDSAGGRLVVRTAEGFWEQVGPRFQPLEYRHGPPRSAALAPAGDALWVSDAAGLYRLARDSNDTVAVPFPRGRVSRLGERLAWWGGNGVWLQPAAGDPWVQLSGESVQLLPTGDATFPALVVEGEAVWLLESATGKRWEVDFPLPAQEVISALVYGSSGDTGGGQRLLLGTAGHGLYWASLPVPVTPGTSAAP